MNFISRKIDLLSIGISGVCAIHCLALPLIITLLPALASTPLSEEHFHQFLALTVIPLSSLALFLGCRQHRDWKLLLVAGPGLFLLGFTALLGHDYLGENGEKLFTLVGATLLAYSHFLNFSKCRVQSCEC